MISEQGGDLDDVLLMRQAELAMADEMGLVLDTDPSEVNGGGGSQPAMGLGAEPAFEETPLPMVEEEQPEEVEEVVEDGDD